MAKLLLISLCLIPLSAFSQPQGRFCDSSATNNIFYSCIDFSADGNFSWYELHQLGQSKGAGRYTINQKRLILTFTKPNPDSVQEIVKVARYISQKDTSRINISVQNSKDSAGIYYAICRLKTLKGKTIASAITDEMGHCRLSVPITNKPAVLEILTAGFASAEIPIFLNSSYNLSIYLAPAFIIWQSPGLVLQWQVLTYSDQALRVRNRFGTISTYTKVTDSK